MSDSPARTGPRRRLPVAALAMLAAGLIPPMPAADAPGEGTASEPDDSDAQWPPERVQARVEQIVGAVGRADLREHYRSDADLFSARQKAKTCPRQILTKKEDAARILDQAAKAVDITCDPGETLELVSQMVTLLTAADGLGLAANQVGVLTRVVVYAHPDLPIAMVNPVITDKRGRGNIRTEGCLSLPNQAFLVQRADAVDVEWIGWDAEAEAWVQRRGTFNGMAARIIQHEVDHLNGILVSARAIVKGSHGRVVH